MTGADGRKFVEGAVAEHCEEDVGLASGEAEQGLGVVLALGDLLVVAGPGGRVTEGHIHVTESSSGSGEAGAQAPHQRSVDACGPGDTTPRITNNRRGKSCRTRRPEALLRSHEDGNGGRPPGCVATVVSDQRRRDAHGYGGRRRTVTQADHVTKWDHIPTAAAERARIMATPATADLRGRQAELREQERRREAARRAAEAELAREAQRAELTSRRGLDRYAPARRPEPEQPRRRLDMPLTRSQAEESRRAALARARAEKRARRHENDDGRRHAWTTTAQCRAVGSFGCRRDKPERGHGMILLCE